ncbi:MAG: hypothetical protein JWM33_3873, partial [Caulobacteraceae bacterium]|nr:hypothetical protein [Caulobacteraceae bacterium]
SWQAGEEGFEIVDFVLSCRAMGRQVENLMASLAVDAARNAGAALVSAELLPTPRNGPCAEFWRSSGFPEDAPNTFRWETSEPYPLPSFIAASLRSAA